jgi:phospholipase D1/2
MITIFFVCHFNLLCIIKVGPIARDISRHFIQRWNFLKASKSMHRRTVPFLMPKGEYVAARDESKFMGTCKVQLLRSSARWSSDIEREVRK